MPHPTSTTAPPSFSLPDLPPRSNPPPPSHSLPTLSTRSTRPTMRLGRNPTTHIQNVTNDLKAVFDMYDDNNNNLIDSNEFARIITLLDDQPPTQPKLESYLRIACQTPPDHPHVPNALDFRQFLHFLATERAHQGDVQLEQVYRILDKNGDGKVTQHELRSVLNDFGLKVSDREARAMLDMVKGDRDDLNFHQFQRLVERVKHYPLTKTLDAPSDESSDEGSKPLTNHWAALNM